MALLLHPQLQGRHFRATAQSNQQQCSGLVNKIANHTTEGYSENETKSTGRMQKVLQNHQCPSYVFALPQTCEMNKLTCFTLPSGWIKPGFCWENTYFFLAWHVYGSVALGQRKQCSFAAACVVNRHLQKTAGRNRANALPAVPPVRLLLLPQTGSAGSIFSGFSLVPKKAKNLPGPAEAGSGCLFRLLSRWEDNEREEGLRGRKRFILPLTIASQ